MNIFRARHGWVKFVPYRSCGEEVHLRCIVRHMGRLRGLLERVMFPLVSSSSQDDITMWCFSEVLMFGGDESYSPVDRLGSRVLTPREATRVGMSGDGEK